jgi:hypothetical protein
MRIKGFFLSLATLLLCVANTYDATAWGATVTGPITGGKQGKPFNAPEFDLTKYGYVAEEYFLDGTAGAFELKPGTTQTSDGRWQVQRRSGEQPYRTRIIVVRPVDANKFNGTVIVHWQNVTAGYELGTVTPGEYLRGYAWVGASVQKVGIDGFPGPDAAGLRQWDPDRYGSLKHPGDDYSFDIYSQVGQLVGPKRNSSGIDPLGHLPVKRVIAAGASQSAGRLRAYINGVHPLQHIFDGYIPYIDFARVTSFTAQLTPPPVSTPSPTSLNSAAPILNRANTIVRTDLDVAVFVINSETEAEGYVVSRQPNTDKFRFWEVAGTSHVTVPRAIANNPEAELRPGLKISALESPNWLSYRPVYDAVIRHMQVWLTTGKAPPEAPLIQMASTNPAKIARDAKGNALGGIRLPEFAAASAEHRGGGTTKPGGYRLGFLYGFSREFTDAELTKLYPNSSAFMNVYDRASALDVRSGYLLKEDATEMRSIAAAWAKRLDHK